MVEEQRHARTPVPNAHQAYRGPPRDQRQGRRVLGQRSLGVRHSRLSDRVQGLRGAGPRERQVAARDVAPDRARKDAAKIIARLKAGLPPVEQEPEPTVADLAERYEREYVAMHCKLNTIKHYGLMLKKHIVPGLGWLRVSEVKKKHILKFQFGLSDMPTVANRTVDILVKMFNMAEFWEMRPPGRNPCRSVRRY